MASSEQWHPDPTPEEIKKACEEIQAGWSPTEWMFRKRGEAADARDKQPGIRECRTPRH